VKKDSLMRCALLYFGLLNTFDKIHATDGLPNLPSALRELGVEWDAYLDTSELSFLKIDRSAASSEFDLGGRELLDRVPASRTDQRDYLVLRDPARAITTRFVEGVEGAGSITLTFTPPDRKTWQGPTALFQMILTFTARKARLIATASAAGEACGKPYDLLILARPDSAFRPRGAKEPAGKQKDVTRLLAVDLERASSEGLGADFGVFRTSDSSNLKLLKNDLLIGPPGLLAQSATLFNALQGSGGINRVYAASTHRCSKCWHLQRSAGNLVCQNCHAESLVKVDTWPEFKMAEHLSAQGITPFCLGITGGVVRT
jgi:hypothetical protein